MGYRLTFRAHLYISTTGLIEPGKTGLSTYFHVMPSIYGRALRRAKSGKTGREPPFYAPREGAFQGGLKR